MKLLILCTPHNPGGRVWTKDELERLICSLSEYKVKVVADEIHHDFVFPGHEHAEFAPLNKEMQENCIVCTAPSKTFNIAGLGLSNIFIPNSGLRTAFQEEMDSARTGHHQSGVHGSLQGSLCLRRRLAGAAFSLHKRKRGLCTELSCRQPSPDCHDASGRHLTWPGWISPRLA